MMDSSGSVDVSLPVLAKASAFVEELHVGGSYELVHQLWSQFTLIAGQVNVNVTWSRDEVLVSALSTRLYIVVWLLINHPHWNVPLLSDHGVHLGKDAWLLPHRV